MLCWVLGLVWVDDKTVSEDDGLGSPQRALYVLLVHRIKEGADARSHAKSEGHP